MRAENQRDKRPWRPARVSRLALVVCVLASVGFGYLVALSSRAMSAYDEAVLNDHPVAYWDMSGSGGAESDLTGNGHNGTYKGGTPATATMMNGDHAAGFNGSSQYMTVPSSSAFSIPTTGKLTWEGWIKPDKLQFASDYTDWMGKCENYSPTCEWESRIYSSNNPENRCNRLSAYVFNPGAGLGSGADWQPGCSMLQAGQWLHVVGEYQTASQPPGCSGPAVGGINIWVNGVKWDQASHLQTGCMSQYGIVPKAGDSALNIGTMALDYWFPGAVGKVAIYDYLLSQSQINAHFTAMTGAEPSGVCGNTCTITVPTQTGTATPVPSSSTGTPAPTATPKPTATGATPSPTATPTPATVGVATLQGTFRATAGSQVIKVDGKRVRHSSHLNTRYLVNGAHSITVEVGGKTFTQTIQVHNQLNPYENARDALFAGFHGDEAPMDGGMAVLALMSLAGAYTVGGWVLGLRQHLVRP